MSDGLDVGLPDASFRSEGTSFFGIFRYPHGHWQTLVDREAKPIPYADAVSATRAALAFVMGRLFRPIVAERAKDLATMAEALGVDDWKARKDGAERKVRRSIEKRSIPRGKGKPPIQEERRRKWSSAPC